MAARIGGGLRLSGKATLSVLNGNFTAANSVRPGGIHPSPGQTTGGNGALSGIEVLFDVLFDVLYASDVVLGADWLRVGTDIVGLAAGQTFNAAFTLDGVTATVAEPGSLALMAWAAFAAALARRRASLGVSGSA